jgi:hypothetical protein
MFFSSNFNPNFKKSFTGNVLWPTVCLCTLHVMSIPPLSLNSFEIFYNIFVKFSPIHGLKVTMLLMTNDNLLYCMIWLSIICCL